jgi:hypothetical protein
MYNLANTLIAIRASRFQHPIALTVSAGRASDLNNTSDPLNHLDRGFAN